MSRTISGFIKYVHFSTVIDTSPPSTTPSGVCPTLDLTRTSDPSSLPHEESITTNRGIGIVRDAQSGYDTARQVAEGRGPLTSDTIEVPLWRSENATFGPES